MAFLKQILQQLCRHRFSWPHSNVDGHDYQVCVICGTAYEYDWLTMRRTRRLPSAELNQSDFRSKPDRRQ